MMTTALSGWPATSLPRTVSPAHDETLYSYLRRLARANGMKSWEFTDYVKGSRRTSDPIPPEVVITLSGQSPNSMRYAILELCSPRELAAMNVAGRPRPGHSIPGYKCIRCAGTSDIDDLVTCWRRSEDVICLPHRRWTAGAEQLDLTGHDDIVQANKQHRRLIRQHGRAAVNRAFTQASTIIEEWVNRPSYCERFYQIMRRFHGREWRIPRDAPTVLASCYLPTVALTRLLASPGWKTLALDPAGNATFVDEVRRTVEPSYTWNPYPYWRYVEPLARTLQREAEEPEAEAADAEFRRKYNIPDPPPRPSEVIESDELCHDH
jgi:hypothetical protein